MFLYAFLENMENNGGFYSYKSKNMELTMLLDNGVDLHRYQPTTAELAKESDCDLFIYVGGESDAWVDGALKEAWQ